MAKRPTKYQRALLRGKGLPVPETRAEASELTTLVMRENMAHEAGMPNAWYAQVHARQVLINELRAQNAELRTLVRALRRQLPAPPASQEP